MEDRAKVIDYDNDGMNDLVFYRPGSGVVYVMRSLGNGQFSTRISSGGGSPNNPAPGIVSQNGAIIIRLDDTGDDLLVGDFNGDGITDLGSMNPEYPTVKTAIMNSNGFDIGACTTCAVTFDN